MRYERRRRQFRPCQNLETLMRRLTLIHNLPTASFRTRASVHSGRRMHLSVWNWKLRPDAPLLRLFEGSVVGVRVV